MSRIDRIMLGRIMGRIGVTVLVFFGLIILIESLDFWRFTYLSELGGPLLGTLGILAGSSRWAIKTLSVTVLLGAIIGILDLKARRELTVISASGISIWRVLRAPLIALVLIGLVVGVFAESASARLNRDLSPPRSQAQGALTADGALWLVQSAAGSDYVMVGRNVEPGGTALGDVTIFMTGAADAVRITASRAVLGAGAWMLEDAIRFTPEALPQRLGDASIATASTPADLQVKVASTADLTFFELAAALASDLTDPVLRDAVLTRFLRLASMPLMLAGSLFIAFAFTAGYRRTNTYGGTVFSGIVLGFVVFVITEMADLAGSAGVLDPTLAALGPALTAIVVGVTVLLYREDGQA
ncbi:LptF/LptG family permease [Arsenicitalea aurantiaca]|uniref:LptF/LptG family permease n=1 Tax=Arsenicitalea aurantiaca TaxID=1783274 RepID=A0A433X388_9HYPH|nr:LptF/LptG family permease [Arsenicitalea aurantiaca]RUT28528.1 LptF/LptG family permease [Arsenicitalea aurantiaca]